MVEWYKKVVFENYANFSGRARRSEYWYFILINIIILISAVLFWSLIDGIFEIGSDFLIGVMGLYILSILIPTLAVLVRRLHDIGKSGWYFFIRFIPFVGSIWLLVLLCTEGNKGRNFYGVDPKQIFDEIDEIGVNDTNIN